MTSHTEDAPAPDKTPPEPVNLMEVFRYLAALHDRITGGANLAAPIGPGGDEALAQTRMAAAGQGVMEGITIALESMVPLLESCGAIQRKAQAPVLTPPDRALRLMKGLRPDPRIDLNGSPEG